MIVLTDVHKRFGKREVLSGITFRIDPGEFICITGPSGAGKSTVLAMLIGAEEPTSGTVEIDGIDLRRVPTPALQIFRRRVGFVFQDYKLLPNRTVAENVAFPLEVCGADDEAIAKRVPEVLKAVELLDRANALPQELSGGEKARAAIARAIVHKPMILLADEPTGNVDPAQSMEILDLFKRIHAQGTTIVLATHNMTIVDTLTPRVIRLVEGKMTRDSVGKYSRGQPGGKTVQTDPPRKHDVFSEDLSTPSAAATESPQEVTRKVKITQIHSSEI